MNTTRLASIAAAGAACLILTACTSNNGSASSPQLGLSVGVLLGGMIGSGATAGSILGTALGAVVGAAVGYPLAIVLL
jgi:hypothetical protein